MVILLFLWLKMFRNLNHVQQKGFQKRPSYSNLVYLLQIPYCIPAVVTGGDYQFCTCRQNLVPFNLQAYIPLLAIEANPVEAIKNNTKEGRANRTENIIIFVFLST